MVEITMFMFGLLMGGFIGFFMGALYMAHRLIESLNDDMRKLGLLPPKSTPLPKETKDQRKFKKAFDDMMKWRKKEDK